MNGRDAKYPVLCALIAKIIAGAAGVKEHTKRTVGQRTNAETTTPIREHRWYANAADHWVTTLLISPRTHARNADSILELAVSIETD